MIDAIIRKKNRRPCELKTDCAMDDKSGDCKKASIPAFKISAHKIVTDYKGLSDTLRKIPGDKA